MDIQMSTQLQNLKISIYTVYYDLSTSRKSNETQFFLQTYSREKQITKSIFKSSILIFYVMLFQLIITLDLYPVWTYIY